MKHQKNKKKKKAAPVDAEAQSRLLIARANEQLALAKDEETRTAIMELLEEKKRIGEWQAHSKKMADVEVNLMYDLANAINALLSDVEERYKHLNFSFRQDKKQAFTSFCDNARKAHTGAVTCFEADIRQAYGDKDAGVEVRRLQANELIRFLLLVADRTAFSNQNYVDAMNFLIDMKDGADLVRQTDLDRFSN